MFDILVFVDLDFPGFFDIIDILIVSTLADFSDTAYTLLVTCSQSYSSFHFFEYKCTSTYALEVIPCRNTRNSRK